MNLSRSELVPEVNEVSELAEGNMALVEESAVAKQSKFIVPEADFLPEVWHQSHKCFNNSYFFIPYMLSYLLLSPSLYSCCLITCVDSRLVLFTLL